MPSIPRLLRHERGARYAGSNTRTDGLEMLSGVPTLPSAHVVGPSDITPHCGSGTAAPAHDRSTRVPGSPVDSTRSAMALVLVPPRYAPIVPLTPIPGRV